jgi:cytochrome c biogenesis protein CcdA
MNHREPPALATWMLDHLRSTENDEALSGDLLEVFRAGRSARWYWYQVIVAIAMDWGRNVWHNRGSLFFAAVWSVFSPAWVLLIVRFNLSSLVGNFSRAPWPWSLICDLVFVVTAATVFIWFGVAVYSTFHLLAFGKLPLRPIRRGFLLGLVAYALAQVCKIAIDLHYPQPASQAEHWGNLTVLGVVENFGAWSTLLRLPYLIGTACALWEAVPIDESLRKLVK